MVSNTGFRSPGELEMTRSTSSVAACRFSASERCPCPSASSRVRASSCFFNSISELGTLLMCALAFVRLERSLRPRVGLFAPLRDKVTSSAQSLVPLPVGRAKDGAYRRERAALVEFRGRVRGRLCRLHYRQVGGLFPLQDATHIDSKLTVGIRYARAVAHVASLKLRCIVCPSAV